MPSARLGQSLVLVSRDSIGIMIGEEEMKTQANGPGAYGDRFQTAYPGQAVSALQQPASMDLHLSTSDYVSSCSHSDDSAAAVPFAQLLSNAAAGGSDWKVPCPQILYHNLEYTLRVKTPTTET